jgi:hypothetical protein
VALGAAIVVGIAIVVAVTTTSSSKGPASGGVPTSSDEAVLSGLPADTDPIAVATGRTGTASVSWTMWAKISATSAPTGISMTDRVGNSPSLARFNRGLCTVISINSPAGRAGATGTGPCLGEGPVPGIDLGGFMTESGVDATLLSGMTANPAARIRVDYADTATPPLMIKTSTNSQLPGIRFFAADVRTSSIKSVTELDDSGSALLTVPYPPE